MKISFSGILFGFISVGIGCFFLAGTWGAYLDYNRVQEYSGQASGQVTKKHFQTAADGIGSYYLDYWRLNYITLPLDKNLVTNLLLFPEESFRKNQ